jgi:predicted alpha/beta hydrolase family esterase
MRTLRFGPTAAATTRIVLLPGAYHVLEDFVGAGFDQALRDYAPAVELVLADPEPAHLNDRRWLAGLRRELNRAGADARQWLGGISLGGYMALRLAAESTQGVSGLCLLAPYLGTRAVVDEAGAALGAPAGDRPPWPPAELAADDDERRVWGFAATLATRRDAPRVFLGFGSEDRFAHAQRLLAQLLPPAGTQVIAGGHDWPVWRQLWRRFLEREVATG